MDVEGLPFNLAPAKNQKNKASGNAPDASFLAGKRT